MTRPSTDHVTMQDVTADVALLQCGHCGDQHCPQLPMPAALLAERLLGFVQMHRRCPKPEAPSPQMTLPGTESKPARPSDQLRELREDDASMDCPECHLPLQASNGEEWCARCDDPATLRRNGIEPVSASAIDASTSAPAPEIDPPGPAPHPHQKFFDLYPLATLWETLLDDCSYGLTGEQFGLLRALDVGFWPSDRGPFHSVAQWARRERAHRDAQLRARDGAEPIAGLTIPERLPMPEPLATLLGEKKPRAKKGARSLTSPKPRRKKEGAAAT